MGWLFVIMIALNFVTVAHVQAQSREATLAALMKLPPAERQARMLEGAKKESGMVWYSSTTA